MLVSMFLGCSLLVLSFSFLSFPPPPSRAHVPLSDYSLHTPEELSSSQQPATYLAREIVELEKFKLDGRSAHFGVPYRFYVGTKTEFFDFIEQSRVFDSLRGDLGASLGVAFADDDAAGLDCGAAPHGQPRASGVVAAATGQELARRPCRPMRAGNMTMGDTCSAPAPLGQIYVLTPFQRCPVTLTDASQSNCAEAGRKSRE